jgi:hypothetical protein
MPSEMDSHILTDIVRGIGSDILLDLAGPVFDLAQCGEFHHLFIDSYITRLGEGDVSSNLRNKECSEKNNEIVKCTYELIKSSKNPVVFTGFPRTQRYLSFSLEEDGNVVVKDKTALNGINESFGSIMNRFLEMMNVTKEMVQKMRLSCKSGRYHTYLADLIAFLVQTDFFIHDEMFEKVKLSTIIVNTNTLTYDDKPLIKPFEKDGRKWTPIVNNDYLYFVDDSMGGDDIYLPKEGSISKVYHQIELLLNDNENGVKQQVRDHFHKFGCWKRVSDYFENDTDDAITLLAIRHAFNYGQLTSENQMVINQLDTIIDPWFEELKIE